MTPATTLTGNPVLERWPGVWPLLLTALALLAYGNSFPGAFIQDDLHIVRNNPLVQQTPDLWLIFTSDYWHGYQNTGLYRPLTILSLALNRFLLGEAPLGFHLVNLVLHAGVTLLLWQLLRRWGVAAATALLAAALFAVHPIHTEVVNEVVGRSELLVAVLVLAALLLADRAGALAGVGAVFCYLLALLSKEHALILPALLLLADAFRQRSLRGALQRSWRLYVAMAVVALGWLLWRSLGLVQVLPPTALAIETAPLAYVDVTTRVLTALQLQGVYLLKLLWPVGLQAVYSSADLPAPIATVFSFRGWLVCVAALAVGWLLWRGWRRQSLVAFFALLYLSSFLITANLLIPIGVIMAERLAYLPSLWFCSGLAVLWAAAFKLRQPAWRWLPLGMAGVYLIFLTGACLARNADFASEVRLWRAEVQNNPDDYLAWQSLAESLANAGSLGEADQAYRQLLELAPEFLGGLRSATTFYLLGERYAEALEVARKSLALSSSRNDQVAIMTDHFNLARINLELQQFEMALTHLEQGKLPGWENAVADLRGRALSGLDRNEEAIAAFDLAGRYTTPRSPYYHGLSLLRLKRYAEAWQPLQQAAEWLNSPESWNLLGVNAALLGDWSAALTAMSRAVERAPDNRLYLDNLQRVRQSAGNGSEAPDRSSGDNE